MLKKILDIADRPRKAATRRALLLYLGFQAIMLLISVMVVSFWPQRASALAGILILCMGVSLMLWVEVLEHRLRGLDAPDPPEAPCVSD